MPRREFVTNEQLAALYVAILATCHVIATWLAGTQPDPGVTPYLVGGGSILAWLILWWFYRRDLRTRWGVSGPAWRAEVVYPEPRHE